MFTLQINIVKTPSLGVPALNYHLVVWMKTSWQDWESEIKQCYQCHARCFSLAGWTKWERSHYHFLWLRMPVPTPCQQCALQLCLKVVSGPIINSMNADFSGNSAQVYYLRPLASSMDCTHFALHLDFRIAQKPCNFCLSWPSHSQAKADNRTQYGDVVQSPDAGN